VFSPDGWYADRRTGGMGFRRRPGILQLRRPRARCSPSRPRGPMSHRPRSKSVLDAMARRGAQGFVVGPPAPGSRSGRCPRRSCRPTARRTCPSEGQSWPTPKPQSVRPFKVPTVGLRSSPRARLPMLPTRQGRPPGAGSGLLTTELTPHRWPTTDASELPAPVAERRAACPGSVRRRGVVSRRQRLEGTPPRAAPPRVGVERIGGDA